MFSRLSDATAHRFAANGVIAEKDFEVCRYGIKQLCSVLLNLVTSLCIGAVLGMLWESVLFLVAYIPLRSYAGGFHAKTPLRCYWYSVGMLAAVLLCLRFLPFSLGTAALCYGCSGALLWRLAPVADRNKPLDEIEIKVYRRRTRLVWCLESVCMIVLDCLQLEQAGNCILWAILALSGMLAAGEIKNRFR